MAFALNDHVLGGVTDPDRSVTIRPTWGFTDTTELYFDYISNDLNFPFGVLFKYTNVRIEWKPGHFVDQTSPYEALISERPLRNHYLHKLLHDPVLGEKAYATVLTTIEEGLVCMESRITDRTGMPLKVVFCAF